MRALIIAITICLPVVSLAGPREQAVILHKRLTGVQPAADVLDQMATLIGQGKAKQAAKIATTNRYFYDITVKSWAAPLTNVDQNPVVPLNDTVATVIGLVRDNIPFTNVLTSDLIYIGDSTTLGVAAYSPKTKDAATHFAALETLNANNNQPLAAMLTQKVQSSVNGITDTAGILTTEAYGEAWFQAGTNRRVFQSMVRNFWCSEMDGIHDTSIPGIRIRRDVTRVPGGSSQLFQNKCLGCHGTMDAAIGGTAYFDFDANNGMQYTPAKVVAKVNRNSQEYPDGYVTTDDSWLFLGGYSATNSFSKIGWRGPTSGNGLHSFATAFAVSRGFSDCMVKRVFKKVCVRDASPADEPTIKMLADSFEDQGNYNLKELFENTAILCME